MCGIVGIIGYGQHASVSPEILERATLSLAHRGPDDGGTVILKQAGERPAEIGLGNRRLAILDLSASGHQPMQDPATGNWIVYNGEIYNFHDVRHELEGAGAAFRSNSDTEVILKAYALWGDACLAKFRGMFAFAIWDAQRRVLFLARDPMGIKPLYYCSSGEYFLFSSEVRTLLGTRLVPATLDPAGLINYLTFGSLYDPNTLVEGIQALPAGHFITWKNGHATTQQYWDLCPSESGFEISAPQSYGGDNTEEEISALLEDAVCSQLVSDVPVGVFLSGGIDSSAIVGILSRKGIRPSTFSLVFREAEYSEAEHSRAVAQHFHTDHHEIEVSAADLFSALKPAIQAMDLPTIDGINTYFVSRHTRGAGVKVALSGLGGDEVFGGYSSFRDVPRMERFLADWNYLPASVRHWLATLFSVVSSSNDGNRKLAALAGGEESFLHPYFLSRVLFTARCRENLSEGSSRNTEDSRRAEFPLQQALSRAQNLDPVNRVSYLESRCYMLNTLLRDSDTMSMAHGLEVRVPLIDHRLTQSILALPGTSKLDRRVPKKLLVRALRGALPDKIVHRPKRGFTLPFETWLRGELRPEIERSLRSIGGSALGALVSQSAALEVWAEFLRGRTSWSRPWSLYVLQKWCERHLSN